jgi:hypothetical protein
MHTVTAAARFRVSMLEALDDSAAELEKLRDLRAVDADVTVARAVTAFLRGSTPEEILDAASSPDVLAMVPELGPRNLLAFRRTL